LQPLKGIDVLHSPHLKMQPKDKRFMKRKAIVIGSGISGLSITRLLANTFDVEIMEAAPKAGGLIKCDRVDGALFHRVGGHVFNSKKQQVLDWFWAHFNREEEFLLARRNEKILFEGKYIGYPL
jgi:protoporphyrinogen oxidase